MISAKEIQTPEHEFLPYFSAFFKENKTKTLSVKFVQYNDYSYFFHDALCGLHVLFHFLYTFCACIK